MKNNTLILLMICFANCLTVNANDFENFYKKNFSVIKLPLDVRKQLKDSSGLNNGLTPTNSNDFYNSILKNNRILLPNKYLSTKESIYTFPLGYFKANDSSIFLVYLNILPYENDKFAHEVWVKSFTENGNVVDSLIIDAEFIDEGIIRKNGIITSDLIFIIKQEVSLTDEDNISLDFKLDARFSLNQGKFSYNGNNILFEGDNYYMKLDEIIKIYKNNCRFPSDSAIGNIDGDLFLDVIYVLRKKKLSTCYGPSIDLLLGNKKESGIYNFKATVGGIALDDKLYDLSGFEINKGIILFKVIKTGDKRIISFFYKFNALIDNYFLIKYEILNKTSGEVISKQFSVDDKVYLFSHSAKLAKEIFNTQSGASFPKR